MRATPRAIIGLFAAAALASVSIVALAQPAPASGPPTPEQRQAWKAKAEARMQEHAQLRAKRLHDLLQLRPDQDPALQTLLAALAPPHDGDHHWGPGEPGGPEHRDRHEGPGADGHDDFAKLTTPERLDKMEAMMSEHVARRQAEVQKRDAAIKAFYAVLTPQQQRAFDSLPRGFGEGGPGHHEDFGGQDHGGWGRRVGAGGPHGPGGPDAPPPAQ